MLSYFLSKSENSEKENPGKKPSVDVEKCDKDRPRNQCISGDSVISVECDTSTRGESAGDGRRCAESGKVGTCQLPPSFSLAVA